METTTYAYDAVGNKIKDALLNGTASPPLTLIQYGFDAADRPTCTAARLNQAVFTTLLVANGGALATPACTQSTGGKALGCNFEGADGVRRVYSVDIPNNKVVEEVYALLQAGGGQELWEFEEAHYCDPNSKL